MEHSNAGYNGDGGCLMCANKIHHVDRAVYWQGRLIRQEADIDKILAEKDAHILALEKRITETPYINPSGKIRGMLFCALNHGSWQPVSDALALLDACDAHDNKVLAEKDALLASVTEQGDKMLAEKDARILALEGTIDQLNARLEYYRQRHI